MKQKPVEAEVAEVAPLETYRADAPFDPNGRMFLEVARFDGKQAAVAATVIHASHVREFLRQPGQGFGRLGTSEPPTSRTWVEIVAESSGNLGVDKGTGFIEETVRQPIEYDPITEKLGLVDGSKRSVRERSWYRTGHFLMSVNAETGPAVYTAEAKSTSPFSSPHETMKAKEPVSGATAPKRNLDAFEVSALAKLRGGDDVALREADSQMRVLGAIRATQDCLKCHNVDVGTLLGAFTYTLDLQSDAIPEADRLKGTEGLTEREVGVIRFLESRGGKAIRTYGGPVKELQMTFNRTAPEWFAQPYPVIFRRPLHDSELIVLKEFPDLKSLDVSHSVVSDAGLKTIAELKGLKKLNVSSTVVTKAGLAEFKKVLPDCEIVNLEPLAQPLQRGR